MGCKASVLPEPLLKNQNVKCLFFEKNIREPYKDKFCLFRAFAVHLFGNERLKEETSKILNIFLSKCGEWDPSKFQAVHMTTILKVEEMLQLNIFLYDFDFAWRVDWGTSTKKYSEFEKGVKLYVTTITFLTSAMRTPFSILFAALHVAQSFQRLEYWSDIWLHAVSESSTFTQRM